MESDGKWEVLKAFGGMGVVFLLLFFGGEGLASRSRNGDIKINYEYSMTCRLCQ